MGTVRVLLIGDVVGEPGMAALEAGLSGLVSEYAADFIIVNGENAAGGFGLTEETLGRIIAAGADVVTSGNHVWEKRDVWPVLDAEERVLRPANYPPGVPGRGWVRRDKGGVAYLTANLQGREGMTPIDCPFRAADALLAEADALCARSGDDLAKPLIFVDFHAESPQEKEALAFYLDGRVCALVGTHTHVRTADERLLPGGTAYVTDLGMTGATGGVIGMDTGVSLERNRTQIPHRMEIAKGATAIRGVCVEADAATGRAASIRRVEWLSDVAEDGSAS